MSPMKPKALDLDAPSYQGEARFYGVIISKNGTITRMGIVAEDLIEAVEEAMGFISMSDDEIDTLEAGMMSPQTQVSVGYQNMDQAPWGIFHGNTKEWHPAFHVNFGQKNCATVLGRAVSWTHLLEKTEVELPFIVFSNED